MIRLPSSIMQVLKGPVVVTVLMFFAMTVLFKIFLVEHSQLLLTSTSVQTRYLSSVTSSFITGDASRNSSSNDTSGQPVETSYSIDEIQDRLKNVTDKPTLKYLSGHFESIQNVVSNLKSDFPQSNATLNVNFRRRVILVTTWRSGSTFLAELLSSYPATYYHYEPFTGHGIHRLRNASDTLLASDMMKGLLQCNYKQHIDKYIKFYSTQRPELMSYNRGLWPRCKTQRSWCLRSEFIDNLCFMYPFQIMKTVRVGVNVTRSILDDPDFSDVRILLLVRDPRGTMASRSHRDWCPKNPDCDQPDQLCQDLVEDYMVSKELAQLYPDRIKIIRYEDMTDHVIETTQDIFKFLQLPIQPETYKFLKEHCDPLVWKKAKIVPQVWNTFRDPSQTSDKWKLDLKFAQVKKIQDSCQLAMKLWNYTPIDQLELMEHVRMAKATPKAPLPSKVSEQIANIEQG